MSALTWARQRVSFSFPLQAATLPVLLAGAVVGSSALAAPLVPSNPNYFPIGVYSQPANAQGTTSFDGWKLRGINTLVGYEEQDINGPGSAATVSVSQWQSAAQSAGLLTIRTPNGSTASAWAQDAATASQQGLIAWAQPDEPENHGIAPSVIQSSYTAWKSAAPQMPVFLNLDGSKVLGIQSGVSTSTYQQYTAGANWVGQDIYPVTGFGSPSNLTWTGQATTATAQLSAKPTFAFIETSNQRLFVNSHPEWNFRGATPGEMRVEIWDSLIHGAKGIMYFPQSFNGFRYDATPLNVAQEMTRQNTIISSVAAVLNSDAPSGIGSVNLGAVGLESMVKQDANGVNYLFVLNTTGNTLTDAQIAAAFPADTLGLNVLGEGGRTISGLTADPLLAGMTDFTDSFDPYALHIYSLDNGAGILAAMVPTELPEPTSAALTLVITTLIIRRPGRRKNRAARQPLVSHGDGAHREMA